MSALSREMLEAIIWPRYCEAVDALCELCWSKIKSKAGEVGAPDWFKEIIQLQTKGVLNLAFSSRQDWIVLPEPLEGFTVVIYKKPQGAISPAAQQKLNLRHHSFDQFCELSQLAEKTLTRIIREHMRDNDGEVIELENEDGHIFIFPRPKMEAYLKALGFRDEQIPRLLSVEDIESDFLNPEAS